MFTNKYSTLVTDAAKCYKKIRNYSGILEWGGQGYSRRQASPIKFSDLLLQHSWHAT